MTGRLVPLVLFDHATGVLTINTLITLFLLFPLLRHCWHCVEWNLKVFQYFFFLFFAWKQWLSGSWVSYQPKDSLSNKTSLCFVFTVPLMNQINTSRWSGATRIHAKSDITKVTIGILVIGHRFDVPWSDCINAWNNFMLQTGNAASWKQQNYHKTLWKFTLLLQKWKN